MMSLDNLTHCYWRAAHVARHPSPDIAMKGAATLWDLALAKTPTRVQAAAMNHLQVLGLAPRHEAQA